MIEHHSINQIDRDRTYYWINIPYSFEKGFNKKLVEYIDTCKSKVIPSSRYISLKSKPGWCWNGFQFALWFETYEDAKLFTQDYPSNIGIQAVLGDTIIQGRIQALGNALWRYSCNVHTP